jgi:hypothetical protein
VSSVKKPNSQFSFVAKLSIAVFAAMWLAALSLWPPSGLLAANTNVNVQVCPSAPYPAPTITEPANGTKTKSSSILMKGQATPGATVYAYRNNVQVGFVAAGGDGTFTISVSLSLGSNVLKASTNNECTGPTFSGSVTVERKAAASPPAAQPGGNEAAPAEVPGESDGQQPTGTPTATDQPNQKEPDSRQPSAAGRPVILEPRNGTHVTDSSILVVGEASANARVRILRNKQVVAEVLSDARGHFTAGITLEPGNNRLTAVIGQGANALSSEEVVVIYEPVQAGASMRRTLTFIGIIGAGTIGGLAVYGLVWHPTFMRHIWHIFKHPKVTG